MAAAPYYSFGPFRFDAQSCVLYQEGCDVGLPPKAAEILSLLLANAGAVLDKTALMDSIWAGKLVGESSLTRTMSMLRRALGDDASRDGYIATISRRGYRFAAPVSRSMEVLSTGNLPSIAVLPFNCYGVATGQEYFGDGLTEELTSELYKQGDGCLRVIARTSCMTFRNSPKRVSEIGRELAVSHVLEGSVRGDHERLRIAAQLIRVSDEMHLWAENYERGASDALRLQCAVAGEIAHEVQNRLVTR
jgi:TolB-like protein